MSLLTPPRTVLMISDDALFIYSNSAKGVRLVESVPWSVESFESHVATIVSKDCGGKPVVIINDMVEQHYRKERLPKVSVMDKQNVLQRKIMVAFPNYPVRAALPLKEKSKNKALSTVKKAGALYLFTAMPNSDPYTKTLGAARRSLVPIAGMGLLPIESSDMVQKLSDKLAQKGVRKSVWTIFISQHRGGGLRQVVVKDGELALTRMTPVIEDDSDASRWSSEVMQEFKATMSYLSRFGYDPSDGIDVILIANILPGESFESSLDIACNLRVMTSHEAAKYLGIKIGHHDNEAHGDVLHVAWIARKNSLRLPMKAKELDRVSRPRQIATLASVVLVLGVAGQGYQLLDAMQSVTTNWDDIDELNSKIAQLDLQYNKEIKRKEDLGFDIQLIQSSLLVRDAFEAKRIDIINLFSNIALGLGRDMRIDHINIMRGEEAYVPDVLNPTDQPKIPLFIADMQLTFPSTMDAKKGNGEVEKLRTALQTVLKDHTVKVTKFLEDYEYSEEIVVQTGDAKANSVAQDYVAEIRIEGPLL